MIFNPIIVKNGTKLPALTNPGTAADLLAGKQLIDAEGNALTGTIPAKSATDLTASGATVTAPAGYYATNASKSVATATQATPSITVSSAGLITASSTQTAGYVAAGTKSATKQLTTKAAATITPGTANQTIASGTYLTGAQTIKGDANLLAANIKSGVSIFGVAGTLASGAKVLSNTDWSSFITCSLSDATLSIAVNGLSSTNKILLIYMQLFTYEVQDSSYTYGSLILSDSAVFSGGSMYGALVYGKTSPKAGVLHLNKVNNSGNIYSCVGGGLYSDAITAVPSGGRTFPGIVIYE